MNLEFKNIELTVVIRAQFNISIFNQFWLVEKGIFSQIDFQENPYTFTPLISQGESKFFHLTVVPDRLILNIKPDAEKVQKIISDKTVKIVEELPHLRYTAIGFNHNYICTSEDNVENVSRALFFSENKPLSKIFDTPDARYGAYYSKDFLGCRLKLDFKPVDYVKDEILEAGIRCNFNYHLQLNDNSKIQDIIEFLNRWEEMVKETNIILKALKD